MMEIRAARDRAVRRAIETGEMPNLDLIHTMQRAEGNQPCFGRADGACRQHVCRWHGECAALEAYRPQARPAAWRAPRRPLGQLPAAGAGTYRDGGVSSGGGQPTDQQVSGGSMAPAIEHPAGTIGSRTVATIQADEAAPS